MNQMTIRTHDHRTVAFDGVLIDQQTAFVRLSNDAEASIVLRLFVVQGGGFVPYLQFSSASPRVADIVDADRVDLLKDVECFFLLFEPTERVEFGVNAIEPRSANADQRFRKTLMRKYYEMVDNTLQVLTDHHASDPSCEGIADHRSYERNRIWKFFGLGRE